VEHKLGCEDCKVIDEDWNVKVWLPGRIRWPVESFKGDEHQRLGAFRGGVLRGRARADQGAL